MLENLRLIAARRGCLDPASRLHGLHIHDGGDDRDIRRGRQHFEHTGARRHPGKRIESIAIAADRIPILHDEAAMAAAPLRVAWGTRRAREPALCRRHVAAFGLRDLRHQHAGACGRKSARQRLERGARIEPLPLCDGLFRRDEMTFDMVRIDLS